MGKINLISAVPLLPNSEQLARAFYQSLQNEHYDALLKSLEAAGNTDFYGAWLQTYPIGPWLIEYRSGDFNQEQLAKHYQQQTDPFRELYLNYRKTFCGDNHNKIQGIRKIINRDLRDVIPAGKNYGNLLKLKNNNVGEVISYLDHVDRATPQQRTEYFSKTGLAYWQVWLQEYDGEHYIVQCHNMRGDFAHFRECFHKEKTPFAKMIDEGFSKHFGMNLDDNKSWQDVDCLLAIDNTDRKIHGSK